MPDAIRYTIMSIDNATTNATTSSPLRQIRKKAAARSNARPSSPLRKRTSSAPARIGNRKRRLLVEDHYRVDPDDKKLLPGLQVNDDDWERDIHDFFNLVSLVPVVVLNVINWNWDILLDPYSKKTMQQAWTGEWFPLFFAITSGYFVSDLIWVLLVPQCVKSPGVIIQHHLATLIYLIIPYRFPEDRWLMGACLSVELNTWLLIARRVFNKQGFGPWVINVSFFSIRIKLISVLFYVTWFFIRCYIYPSILKVLWTLWFTQWKKTGAIFNSQYVVALILHFIFCVLNFKWTFDLFMSKWRALRSGKPAKVDRGL
mmetsp:Transcript_2876/g.5333  ORF Transcript_2876/g.5333 Transcript_2876/m.5333 type:complete len:315 (-) Transcript_2876:948-1892(-)